MAGTQTDSLQIYDSTTGLTRTIETGATPDSLELSIDLSLTSGANLLVDGNLVVNGTTTTIHSEQVNIADNYLYLNADYTADAAQTGGIVINVDPTTTTDTVDTGGFTAGVAATSNPTVITSGSATFSTGDIIQISGAADQANDGIYEVLSHVGTTLTIRGIGTTATVEDFTNNQFVDDTTVQGDITLINVAVLRSDTTGTFQTAYGSSTPFTFTDVGVGNVTLQDAYEAGNTITTSATEGDVTITGTEDLVISLSDLLVDTTASISLDADAASNFTVAGFDLTLSTTGAGNTLVSSAAEVDLTAGTTVDINATTTVTIDTADAADASGNDITLTAGTSTAGTAAGGSIILQPGDGDTTGAAGSVDIVSPADEDESLLNLTSTGTNGNSVGVYVGSSNPDGAITALAGSLFLRDSGTGAVAYLNTSTGSGTTWTAFATGGTVTLQTAYENGNTITTSATEGDITFTGTEDFVISTSDLLVDTTASISLDAITSSNFTVTGNAAGATELTLSATNAGAGAGNVLVSADDEIDLTAGTTVDINATAGAVTVDAGTTVDINATTTATIDTANATDASGNDITLTAGSSTGGTNAGASIILTPGDGDTTGAAGDVTISSPADEDEVLLTLTSNGTNGNSIGIFTGTSDPSGAVTADAGSLFSRDTGTGSELYLNTSTGSGTTWTELAIAADITLQQAYIGGNTITTNATEGDVTITGTEDLIVSTSDLLVDTTSSISLDAITSSNFTVTGNAAGATELTLSATNAGAGAGNVLVSADDEIDLTSGGLLDINAGANLDIDVTGTYDMLATGTFTIAGTGASSVSATTGDLTLQTVTSGDVDVISADSVTLTAGDEAAAAGNVVTIDAGNGGGANDGGAVTITGGDSGGGATGNGGAVNLTGGAATSTDGNGGSVVVTTGAGTGTGTAGSFDVTGPNNEDEALVTLTTTGTNGDSVEFFVGDSDPSGAVTGLAGSLFFRDTGTGSELYLNTSTGSGTTWTELATLGDITLQQAYIGGNTITTNATEGDVTITGTEDLIITLSDLDVDTTASITLNADAASNFTVDTTGAAQDLTISVAGATDSSLVLSSSGTGGDALQITATAGGIDVNVAATNTDALEISDGTNEYININSSDVTVDLNQFTDIVGSGVGIRITTADTLVAGDLVTIQDTTGEVELADANTGTLIDGLVAGVSQGSFTATTTALIYTVPGSLIPVRFASAPAAANNGDVVFLSTTPGVATLTPPGSGKRVIFQVGYLVGADGATTTPTVLYLPRFVTSIGV